MLDLIKGLSNVYGAPGFEDNVVEFVKENSDGLEFSSDSMMNVFLKYKNTKNDLPTLMLDAHLDEVAFLVQSIDAKGLLNIIPLGGWVVENVPAQLFMVKTNSGKYVKGIVTSKPPHFMTEEERNKKINLRDLKIDLGATSREEVVNDIGISVGAPCIPFVEFEYNEKNGTMLGKAFDNRLGCAAVIETMKQLQNENLPVNLVGALATQEEVGMRGAEVTTKTVRPNFAIVFEGSPSDDFYFDEFNTQGALGKGVQIRIRDNSYISHHRLTDFAVQLAKKHNIPYQMAVRTGGSTNAGKIHLVTGAVPVLVLGVPVRYIHTHHCFAKLDDFKATIELAKHVIKNIDRL